MSSIIYKRSGENVRKLADCLARYNPYLRGAPPGLPFKLDEAAIMRGLNFTLTTAIGDLDILGEIAGGGTYEDLVPDTVQLTVFGEQCLCLSLHRLIQTKRAAGRPKDLEVIAELETLLQDDDT